MEEIIVNGLVVRETDIGDYDKLLTVVTNELGKIYVDELKTYKDRVYKV